MNLIKLKYIKHRYRKVLSKTHWWHDKPSQNLHNNSTLLIREHIYAFKKIRYITNSIHSIVLQCLRNKFVHEYENENAALSGYPLHVHVHCTTYPEHGLNIKSKI